MRIWILSDLHMEFEWFNVPNPIPAVDVCVCAGDIKTKGVVPSIQWLAKELPPELTIVFVAGNHEFYRGAFEEAINDGRGEAAKHPNIHFLEDDAVDIAGVRFIGASLWTDFGLYGDAGAAMDVALRSLNDYRLITYRKTPFERLHPAHTAKKHAVSRAFLEAELAKGDGIPKVVVTHHAPSLDSVAERYKHDTLTAAFASDMDEFMERHAPKLWIHGHVHHRVDYTFGSTRVIANPRGYPHEACFRDFDPSLVIEI